MYFRPETEIVVEIIRSVELSKIIIIIIMVLFYLFIQYYAVLKEISIR